MPTTPIARDAAMPLTPTTPSKPARAVPDAATARSRQRKIATLRLGLRALGTVSPPLAARAAEKLFRTPPAHVPWSGERAILAEGRRSDFTVRGAALAAWTWGADSPTTEERLPVLLVHGWGSTGGRLGSFVAPLLATGHRVIAFDAPGHGENTGGPADGEGRHARRGRLSSLPEFIFAVEAAHAAFGPFAGIIGHSLGGAASTLAMGRGVRARRVVLLAPTGDPALYTRRFAEILGVSPSVRTRMEARLVRQFGMQWPEFDVPAAARGLDAPALVFHDRDDAEIPWSEGASVAGAWPGAELVTTQDLGHKRIVHDPDVVARAVRFLTAAA